MATFSLENKNKMATTTARVVELPPAGKLIIRGHGTKECISPPKNTPPTPEAVRKLRLKTLPEPGERRVVCTPEPASLTATHGKISKESEAASNLVNPPPLTRFQSKLNELKEEMYISACNSPLGEVQQLTIPSNVKNNTFGKVNCFDMTAGELVSPNKTPQQVEEEAREGMDLYRASHECYQVGEQIDRNYDWSKFTRHTKYGVPTPHDITGMGVAKSLQWRQGEKVVMKQLDDYREKSQPQIGTVHDPIADSMNVDPKHTFGIAIKPDEYSGGELVHMTSPSTYLSEWHHGILASIRHHLKNNRFTNFEPLKEAFVKLDKDKTGKVDKEAVKDIFFQFQVPLEPEMVELLVAVTANPQSQSQSQYTDLVALVNWKFDLPDEVLSRILENCQKFDDHRAIILKDGYRKSSDKIRAATGYLPTDDYKISGVPTIRSDRPAPRIRRVSDHTNYGDESDARGLMYPSIYTARGVYEQDFFLPMSQDEIKSIFASVGVSMTDEEFTKVWTHASSMDPSGQVCVESFRVTLEKLQSLETINE